MSKLVKALKVLVLLLEDDKETEMSKEKRCVHLQTLTTLENAKWLKQELNKVPGNWNVSAFIDFVITQARLQHQDNEYFRELMPDESSYITYMSSMSQKQESPVVGATELNDHKS